MKKQKNNKNLLRWILLGAATVSVIIGFIICLKKQYKPSELIPSITGFFTLAATLILDGKAAKKDGMARHDNTAKDIEAMESVIVGSGNRDAGRGKRGGSEKNTGLDKYSGKNSATNIKSGGTVIVGDDNEF
ncbi:MAG: hypothetical protein IKZ82_12085 [Clostridia bacterium]|nr:hypothetical protein [Clostridia bacterium]